MTVVENIYRDKVFIEFTIDIPLPNPNGKDVVWCMAQSQLCWTRKIVAPASCASCGGALSNKEYHTTGRVGEVPFGFTLVVPAQYVNETTTKRVPNPCTNSRDDMRGIDVQDNVPPHLRDGYRW